MWAEERQRQILEILQRDQRAEADTLATTLEVSRETIRRDLKILERAGAIQRTHGGALISSAVVEEPFSKRVIRHAEEKRAIAAAAVRLVEPGQCCFVDAGSTTAYFAGALATVRDISVITNSIEVAMAMQTGQPRSEVILLGGKLGRDVPATFGGIATGQLASLRADLAFISPVGISSDSGVSYFDLGEADVARAMLAGAHRRVVLADGSKCGVISRIIVCPCSQVDVLVTDHNDAGSLLGAGIAEIIVADVGNGLEP